MSVGTLYIVATPIGNLADMTFRAVEVLQNVDVIACEDTRHSQRLLHHYSVDKPLVSLHSFNEKERGEGLVARLLEGVSVAVISDAGTPLINDPGFDLVRRARAAGVMVTPVPGPSSVTAALSVSGLPMQRFCFEGFVPAKKQARLVFLTALERETRAMVFFETPHRILESLEAMATVFGEQREVMVARELTKRFETIVEASFTEVLETMKVRGQSQKGEFVIVVQGESKQNSDEDTAELDEVLGILLEELSVSRAAAVAARICGCHKNKAYKRALDLEK